jgi:hypothetical protein
MKRVVLIALSVALFAGVANAQTDPGTANLWLSAVGGGNTIDILVSETTIIQLWMEYTAPLDGASRLMIGMDAMLQMKPDPPAECIEVVGFNGPGPADEYGPWGINGTFFTKSRGMIDESPFDGIPDYTGCGNIDPYYMYIATVYGPYDHTTGLPANAANNATGAPVGNYDEWTVAHGYPEDKPFAMLLDEIIIHGNCDTGTTYNKVFFQSGGQTPKFTELTYYAGEWVSAPYNFLMGTGSDKPNALKIHVSIPEPGSLALLAFGGLAAIRRRR